MTTLGEIEGLRDGPAAWETQRTMTDTQNRHNIAPASDLVFLVSSDGRLTRAPSTAYAAEAELQKLLADNIDLLPGAQINPANPRRWLLIKREAGVPNRDGGGGWWSIDHLAVDQDAVPTFVEVKRASDTRARREVVAQMLDYAANGSVFWTPEQLRSWFEDSDPVGATERLAEFLDPSDDEPEDAAEAFWQKVGTNLREGLLRLVFVADEIPASLQRLVEFLNEQMPRVEVLALEIRQYQADGTASGALVPRLIGQTSRAQAAKEQPASAARRSVPWKPVEVVEDIARAGGDSATAEMVREWATAHTHIKIGGGTGAKYRSFTMAADTGRSMSRYLGVLTMYSSPYGGGPPMLEIHLKRMRGTPPYDRDDEWAALMARLRSIGIPRLSSEADLAGIRPNIPLDQLTDGRLQQLLALVEHWIGNVRARADDSEPAGEA